MSDPNKGVLDEKLNPNYYEALKEIAELLTFVPEENRGKVIDAFVKAILHA